MRRRSQLGLIAAMLALGLQSSAGAPLPAGLVGSFLWTMDDSRLGGMSAIVVDPDGLHFTALSDRRHFFEGTLVRDAAGHVTGVADITVTRVTGTDGQRLRRRALDTEGMARAPDSSLYVSLEDPAQIAHFASPAAGGEMIDVPDAFADDFARNASLEAVAVDADRAIYTIPEDTADGAAGFPVWRDRGGDWSVIGTVPRQGGFLVTDASVGPDGRLYVLERAFHGLFGFQSRLSRFAIADGLGAQEVLVTSATGQHDNLEGLSVWRDGGGTLIATMISDDNFRFFQRTEIVEYRLPD